MRRSRRNLSIAALSVFCVVSVVAAVRGQDSPPPPPQMQQENAREEAIPFYSVLQPHGTWMQVVPFGMVWQPTVFVSDRNWKPYYDGGKWAWSNGAWEWRSEYSWGWAPFHYGRWTKHRTIGWVWVPGRDWSPAWVVWEKTPTEYRWAPSPADGSMYINVSYSTTRGIDWGFELLLGRECYVSAPLSVFGITAGHTVVYETSPSPVLVAPNPNPVVVVSRSTLVERRPYYPPRYYDRKSDHRSSHNRRPIQPPSSKPAPIKPSPPKPAPSVKPLQSSGKTSTSTNRRTTGVQNVMSRLRK